MSWVMVMVQRLTRKLVQPCYCPASVTLPEAPWRQDRTRLSHHATSWLGIEGLTAHQVCPWLSQAKQEAQCLNPLAMLRFNPLKTVVESKIEIPEAECETSL